MTRITYGMISDNVQIGIQSNAGKLNTLMTQLATGKALNQPSDDSVGVVKALKLHSQTNRQDQYLRNMQDGISLVQTAEANLDEVHSMLQRMRELAVQHRNGTMSAASISTRLGVRAGASSPCASARPCPGKCLNVG